MEWMVLTWDSLWQMIVGVCVFAAVIIGFTALGMAFDNYTEKRRKKFALWFLENVVDVVRVEIDLRKLTFAQKIRRLFQKKPHPGCDKK